MPDIGTTRSTSILSLSCLWAWVHVHYLPGKPSSHTVRFSSWHAALACQSVTVCFAPLCQPSTQIARCQFCCTAGFGGCRSPMHLPPAPGSSPFPGNNYSSSWLPFISSLAAVWIFFRRFCLMKQPPMY